MMTDVGSALCEGVMVWGSVMSKRRRIPPGDEEFVVLRDGLARAPAPAPAPAQRVEASERQARQSQHVPEPQWW